MKRWTVALALTTALAATPARADTPDPDVDISVTLDPGAGTLGGHVRLRVTNRSDVPITEVPLWLYPNHLAERSAALNDVNYHWLYPGLFSPAAMTIGDVRVNGTAASVTLADTPAGAQTIARVPLAPGLPPGASASLEIDFSVRVPQRFGGFGCDRRRCRFMGGFYPMPALQRTHGFDLTAPPARAGRARVSLRSPTRLALVLDGEPVVWPGPSQPVTVDSGDLAYPTIVTDRVLRPDTITVGKHLVRYLHRAPRPPGSEDQPLPYVREDTPALVLATAQRALRLVDALMPGTDAPITLVEAPLRHQLVQPHPGVVLVSDQLFRIFPIKRLRKYHHLELVRAIVRAVLDQRFDAMEAGVLAEYLTELYAVAEFHRLEYAADLLRPFDFVPAVDDLLYAPLLASAASYFGAVGDRDEIRDDVRLFADPQAPTPRLIYSKLLDLLGPSAFPPMTRRMLNQGQSLQRAAEETFGASLDWFWRQWLGPLPRVNYRLEAVRVSPRPSGGVHVEIDVRRQGATLREPVEVLVTDRGGGRQTLRWDDDQPGHLFALDLTAGLKAVEIDPRERLVQSAVGSLRPSDDPRYDDRKPLRWRLLYEGFGALLNVSNFTANFEAAFLLKPQHDLRHEILLTAFHSEATQIGAGGTYYWNFGDQVTHNQLSSSLLGGLSVSRINPTFGLSPGDVAYPGTRVSARAGLAHDTRDFLYDPWRAVGLSVSAGYAATLLEHGGGTLSQVSGGAEALRLFEVAPGQVFGVDVTGAATAGDIRLPGQLTAAGGPAAMRGYFADELLARANVVGSVQFRSDYISGLDWNLLHLTSVRGLAGTVFFDTGAITSCDDYKFTGRGVYYDVGYSFRVLHDAFGVYQQLLSIDFAVPLNRHVNTPTCLGRAVTPVAYPPFVFLVSFVPSF
ncbi:MAG TPA: hypothetical protein VMT03_10365 [Polyangia bacterium]|nr:hypothetical protein [Polyangia bacterium]